ncbi:MAG: sigma-54 dependent transcriptional regulator [Desulfovibrio sp.]|nr:sigma-54 dependent transcriptional regulator [Desulfovibrio sp.]
MDLNTSGIIGQSTTLAEVFKVLGKVAPTDSTVLVTGESGTGKELLVRALHANSRRADKPFVPINCGAIPKELLESELFGHEKGAFTHAIRSRPGRFELADGGTIFLDEIGEMELNLQVKILRVLQEKEIERVGGTGVKKVDVRIVAATNRDLEAEVAAGRFREDLYYRLNVIPLHLPPLRERGGDVLLLAEHFLSAFCAKKGRANLELAPLTRRILTAYSWPGNVRELENFMERLSILVDGSQVRPEDLPRKILDQVGELAELPALEAESAPASTDTACGAATSVAVEAGDAQERPLPSGEFVWPNLDLLQSLGLTLKDFLEAVENRLVDEAMRNAGGVKNQAAEILGIKRTTLIEKLKKRA